MTKIRVVAAMSGGVDSCVAAALLQEQGYDVVGITMQLWNHAGDGEARFDSCCSLTDVHDARLAAHRLGIPHYVVNYEKEFKKSVVDYFASEYGEGRTPNPCVMCNSQLKFDHLVERAKALGAEWVATGHYARVVHHGDGRPSELLTGVDPQKDQSYFLFDMNPQNLSKALFPLGGLTKAEVRQIAAGMGLHTAEKHESQEICFVTGKRYTDFLAQHYPEVTTKTGEIVDPEGRVLGYHNGIHQFTVGQRKGLQELLKGVHEPRYVKAIDARTHRVVVDELENLKVSEMVIERPNWLLPKLPDAGESYLQSFADRLNDLPSLAVMVRYRARLVACHVERVTEEAIHLSLNERASWVTPGQAAVIYSNQRVVGGGFIASERKVRPLRSITKESGHQAQPAPSPDPS